MKEAVHHSVKSKNSNNKNTGVPLELPHEHWN